MVRLPSILSGSRPYNRRQVARKRRHAPALGGEQPRLRLESLEDRRLLAAGAVDATYGNFGVALAQFGSNTATTGASVLQADGKLLVAGGLRSGSHQALGFIVARFNADGSLDDSFGIGGEAVINPGGEVRHMAIQPDGKILICGDNAGNLQQNLLARLTPDGAIDATFGNGGEVVIDGISSDFDLRPDGKIINVQGDTGFYRVTQFNVDGSVDSSFGANGTVVSHAATVYPPTDMTIAPDGKILVCSDDQPASGAYVTTTRFDANGHLDSNFGNGGTQTTIVRGVLDELNCVTLQPDGKILVGGDSLRPVTNAGWDLLLMRYNSDGSLDTTFGGGGVVIDTVGAPVTSAKKLFVEPNGKILAAGRQGDNAALFRFNPDGSPDDGFGVKGIAVSGFQYDSRGVAQQADGNYLLAGTQGAPSALGAIRFLSGEPPAAALDPTFGSQGIVLTAVPDHNAGLMSVITLPDGKLLAAGTAQPYGENGNYTLARYNPDGSLDASFGVNGLATTAINGQLWGAALQSDGKIVVAGNSIISNNTTILRYNSDGSLDASFGTNGRVNTPIGGGSQVAVQADGKIVVISGYQGGFGIARYNADGSLDATFGTGGIVRTSIGVGDRSNPWGLAIQPDQKIVVTGWVWNGTKLVFGVVRYNADGSLDQSFGTGGIVITSLRAYHDGADAIGVQADGKIVVSGSSATNELGAYGSTGAIVRYNADGTLDQSFGQGGIKILPFTSWLGKFVIQPGGDIVAAGMVGYFGLGVFRFHSDGSLDTNFHGSGYAVAPGILGAPQGIAVQADGNYVVAGTALEQPNNVFVLARFLSVAPPTTAGLTDVTVNENSSQTRLSLWPSFSGGKSPSSLWTYAVVANTNPALFSSIAVDNDTGELTLTYARDVSGNAVLTIRATDPDGFSIETPLKVGVNFINRPPSFVSGVDVVINENAGDQSVADWAVNISPGPGTDEANQSLHFIVSIDDPSLFAIAPSIDPASGALRFTPAANTSGVAHVSVRLQDDGGTANGGIDASALQTFTITIQPTGAPHERYVKAVFRDVLGRAPDDDGLAHWTARLDAGAAISSVAAAIAHSDEYYANRVIKPGYLKLLGRDAEAAGVKHWLEQLHGGLTDQEFHAALASSDEFYRSAGGTNIGWLDAVYSLLLGRPADTAGESHWDSQLSAGQSLNQVARRIVGSRENNAQLIGDDYIHYLHRAADDAGLTYWLKQFASGKTNEDLIASFTASDEYYAAHTG